MAPARSSTNRVRRDQVQHAPQPQNASSSIDEQTINDGLFLDPLMGTPLAIYVEKDVDQREEIVHLITENGGIVSTGYSGVAYILVDPHKESGQSLYRQFVGKKGKIVLNAQWVVRCVQAHSLQTYHNNFGGCKVTGQEEVVPTVHHAQSEAGPSMQHVPQQTPHEDIMQQVPPDQVLQQQQHGPQLQPSHGQHISPPQSIPIGHPAPIVAHASSFPYPVYSTPMEVPPRMPPPTTGPPQTWQAPNGIAPSQTHLAPPPPPPPAPPAPPEHHMIESRHPTYGEEQTAWNGPYHPIAPPAPGIVPSTAPPEYTYRYRDDQAPGWAQAPDGYYNQQYEQTYPEAPDQYMEEAGPSHHNAEPDPPEIPEKAPRGGRKRKVQLQPAPPASTLVANRRNPPARSPTPPTRIIKSTYGGNLFTSDDIEYLKRYIDYCQQQGLVLSLREICERIAIKAPHHTFYSWRRFCNKHKIRLGGYAMDLGADGEDQEPIPPPPAPEVGAGPSELPQSIEEEMQGVPTSHGPGAIVAAHQAVAADVNRARSPTPPRALYRSTTGKGVAFTDEDVVFLVRFLAYRTRQPGKLDMTIFWKDVAAKAPHHSRASWMKFYRRHKHELHHAPGDEPLPAPPEKKMRYSRQDDILLAKFFHDKPEGTSDKIFQSFGRQHPHHPWKGWQEHHRIYKATIDHLIQRLSRGESIDEDGDQS